MGRFRRRMFDEYAAEFSTNENFNLAYRKVKRIKGFYSHLNIFVMVNTIIIVLSLNQNWTGIRFEGNGLLDWHTYSTLIFWGIPLLGHAFSVFGLERFFGADWEHKKIQKYMEKDTQNHNKWE